jgi:CheY-like chemotaxis protein
MARILIVDDHPLNLKLASEVLAAEGFEIEQARDADEAIVSVARDPPDLVLMDLALPGMDGLTLTRKLKDEYGLARVPIVALTAFAMKGDAEKALAAGCDGYITKPIDTRSLPLQVVEFLSHFGQADA